MIVSVWPGKPTMVVKTFVVMVVGSPKRLAVAVTSAGTVMIAVEMTETKDILCGQREGQVYRWP